MRDVATLLEALPYIREFHGKTAVIKYGGAAMEDQALREEFARDVVLLKYVGLQPIVVHGGGPDITSYMERLGLPVQFVGGLRVSDEATVEVAKMVLVGKVNKEIVGRLARHGQPAVGLCGDDGSLFRVSRRSGPTGEDIGFVGSIERVNVDVLQHIARDYIPVIASVGADREGHSYNINADEAAGAVARALGAYKVVFLTDVPGWLADPNDPASLIAQATAEQVRDALPGLEGGMAPKLQGAWRRSRGASARPTSSTGANPTRCCWSFSPMQESARRSRRRHEHVWLRWPASSVARVHSTPRSLRPWPACPTHSWGEALKMTLAELQEIEATSLMPTYARFPVEFVRGEGARLWDAAGEEYLDFLCGISVTNLGHCHPRVVAAVREQVGRLMHVRNLYYTEPAMRLAGGCPRGASGGRCSSATPAPRPSRRRSSSPARRAPAGRSSRCWAPSTGAPMARSPPPPRSPSRRPSRRSSPAFASSRPEPEALPPPWTSAPPPCCWSRSRGRPGSTCSPRSCSRAAREACDDHGAALIFDEIQCGMGRTGTLWAYEQTGVVPDALTSAKALAGGLPAGALVTGERLADVLGPGDHGSTFGGGPVVAAAALAVLEVLDDSALLARVGDLGARLAAGLSGCRTCSPCAGAG